MLLAAIVHQSNAQSKCINFDNVCVGEGATYRPIAGCHEYAQCGLNNDVLALHSCGAGTIFDSMMNQCNWDYVSYCDARKSCAPTKTPTQLPSTTPTESPLYAPSGEPSASPTGGPTREFDFFRNIETDGMRREFETIVFRSYTSQGIAFPSTRYTYSGLMKSLREMAFTGIPYNDPVNNKEQRFLFYLGYEEEKLLYGQVNVAAFLANAVVESIQYDTCDEFNWDQVSGRYAISNSCGQNFRSYQDELCTNPNEVDMSCAVDTSMEVTSATSNVGREGKEPPPFICQPKADVNDYPGYWDTASGTVLDGMSFSNTLGRVDTEGCCWWGRGSLLTRGVCNIGKLNYYLGKRAFDLRGEARFQTIDFCADPEATCASESSTEDMRWITGMFEWVERIQSYDDTEWNYLDQLKKFVDRGMNDDDFISSVSSIVTRGCPSSSCSNSRILMEEERKENFQKIMDFVQRTDPPTESPTDTPTPQPQNYTPYPTMSQLIDKSPPVPEEPVKMASSSPTFFPTNDSVGLIPVEDNSSNRTAIIHVTSIGAFLTFLYFLLVV